MERDAIMALAWVKAEERRRATTSRSWEHDPWRGGFGPASPREHDRPRAQVVLGVQTAQGSTGVAALSPRIGSGSGGRSGVRERLSRRGLLKSPSFFNLRWRASGVV